MTQRRFWMPCGQKTLRPHAAALCSSLRSSSFETHFRDGQLCHDCLGGSSLPALVHGCYRARPLTAHVVFGSWLQRTAW
jgi:hypothetical protein